MKPIQLKNMKRTNCWSPKGKVWYQKNDDSQSAHDLVNEAERDIENTKIILEEKEGYGRRERAAKRLEMRWSPGEQMYRGREYQDDIIRRRNKIRPLK